MNVLTIQPRGGFMLRGITHPVCRDLMMSATFLKKRGHTVRVWDRCVDRTDFTDPKSGFHADAAVFFISQSSSVKDAIAVSARLRSNGTVIVWADMVALLGADLPDTHLYCDYLLLGEYCFTADELLRALQNGDDASGIAGLAVSGKDGFTKTEKRPLPAFSELYPIDWTLIDVEKCFRRFQSCKKMLYLNASTGCPYACGFCSTPACYGQRRKRPFGHVLSEIDFLVRNHGLDGINFSDELLLFTDEELAAMKACRERNGNSFVWGGETRPQLLSDATLQKMYDAGCRWLLFGLESGSETVRARLSKGYDPARVAEVVDRCTELGISTFGSFIVGFPGETPQDLRETVRFASSLDLDAFLFNYFVMIAETPLYEEAVKSGRFCFRSILEYDSLVNTDKLDGNFSRIPYRELATVKAYFDFLTITRKKKTAAKDKAGAQFLKKAINTAAEYLRGSPKEAAAGLWSVAKRGVSVAYYPLAHPGIVKKYGLHNVNRK